MSQWDKIISKLGHFGDISKANLLAWYGKQNLTRQRHAFTNQNKCTTTKKTKARGLIASYDIWPENGAGLFSKEKISKGADK